MHNSAHTHHDGSSCLQSQWQAERYTDRTTPQSSDQSRSAMARRRVGLARAVVARNFGRAAVLFPPRKLRASAVPHSQQHRRQKGKEAAEVSASTHARAHARERASERVVFLAASRCCRREHSQPSLDSDEGAMLASHPLPPQWPHFFGQQASLSLLRIQPAAWHSFSGTWVLVPLVELPVGGCFPIQHQNHPSVSRSSVPSLSWQNPARFHFISEPLPRAVEIKWQTPRACGRSIGIARAWRSSRFRSWVPAPVHEH
jgi:hypothetical protein